MSWNLKQYRSLKNKNHQMPPKLKKCYFIKMVELTLKEIILICFLAPCGIQSKIYKMLVWQDKRHLFLVHNKLKKSRQG